jgi:HD-like signal output (HDOD) protein
MTSELKSLIAGTKGMISLPENLIETHRLINNPDSGSEEIAASILKDPSLSAKLLAMANSAYYGHNVDRVSRAVTVLGHNQLRLLLVISMASDLFNGVDEKTLSVADFWTHSALTSITCKHLAKASNVLHAERLQVTGLLHEIGLMILLSTKKNEAAEIFSQKRWSPTMREKEEKAILGFCQQDVGAVLFESWNFPASLSLAIKNQRSGQDHDSKILLTSKLVAMMIDGEKLSDDDLLLFESNKALISNIGLEELSQQVHHEFEGFFQLIQPGVKRPAQINTLTSINSAAEDSSLPFQSSHPRTDSN